MLKEKIHIMDNLFSHAKSTSLDNTPSNFEWDRSPNSELTIFSDSHVFSVDAVNTSRKIAWLIESPILTKNSYDFVKLNSNKFDQIFTFDKEILDSIKHSELVPIGGCWIPIDERKIHQKTKKISIIASQKNFLPGHRLRHEVIGRLPNLDVYGRGYNEIPNKLFGLKDYQFSISIENAKKDYYFTEKLIDCFITGTIPIYWGCPSIGDFFDIGGIITFDSLDQLDGIINSLDGEYEKRIESVKRNFELCKKYLVADDIIYEKIKK